MTPNAGPAEIAPHVKPDDAAAALFAEQVRLLYRLSRPGFGGTLAVALIALCGLWNAVPAALLVGWSALVATITVARYFLCRRYDLFEHTHETAYWVRWFVAGAAIMGGMWGVLGSLLSPAEFGYQLLIIFVIAGHGCKRLDRADAGEVGICRVHAAGVAAADRGDVSARRSGPCVHRRGPDRFRGGNAGGVSDRA